MKNKKNKLQAHPEVRDDPKKTLYKLQEVEKYKIFFVENKDKTEEQLLEIVSIRSKINIRYLFCFLFIAKIKKT